MTLLRAEEDLVVRTLAALANPWQKLAYLAHTKESDQYQHWGLTRVYGQSAASCALAKAHSRIWIEILRTPIRELGKQSQDDARDLSTDSKWISSVEPFDLAGGSREHFKAITFAMSSLAEALERGA